MSDDRDDAGKAPTETQPKPNISTEPPRGREDDATKPTETQPAPNISTEHAPEGSARRPAGGLDR